jgi:hypothetical protein
MSQQTTVKRSAAAAAQNTDTTIFTPAAGIKYKVLVFYVCNEVAAQAAGMNFELRFGSNIIAMCGFNVAAAPIGGNTPVCIIAHEFVGDGVTAILGRNLTALAATSIAAYVVAFDANY